jgi:hypothetical protein
MRETTIDLSVGGVDVVQYMVETFDYTQEQGEQTIANIAAAINSGNSGTMEFRPDKTYKIAYTSGDTEEGSWSINEEGTELSTASDNS